MSQLALFQDQREKLFGLAYRMLGSVVDAEDILQDAYLKWSKVDPASIETPQSYLVTVVTRLCIDRLTAAQKEREYYPGQWLPQPLPMESEALAPQTMYALSQHLSIAFLMMLEKLNPLERAVFVLREAFGFSHKEIAQLLDKTDVHCRQLDKRARTKLKSNAGSTSVSACRASEADNSRLYRLFVNACQQGALEPLLELLADEAVLYSDGGRKVSAVTRPLQGRLAIQQLLTGALKLLDSPLKFEVTILNGEPALMVWSRGQLNTVIQCLYTNGLIQRLYALRNPEKLRHLINPGSLDASAHDSEPVKSHSIY